MKILFALITIITFILFFIEALIHFNIGKKSRNEKQTQTQTQTQTRTHNFLNIANLFTIHIPDKSEFIQIFVTVLIFSILSGFSSSYIIKHVLKR